MRPGDDPDVIMMICTAGHVDHGKTCLVKLLTGCETDRLEAEKQRGLTIELGFAPCLIGGNLCVGIVDVPGHEKFIKNMVAGVSGIDMTILVVAADDGIMPQTVEHFQIMDLLGVRHGIAALTKVDLVSEERVTEVTADLRSFLNGTFMEDAPICPVSSETGEGYFEFYDILTEHIRGLVKRRKRGIFRMPIERVFLQKGFGAVVTGIPVDGTIEVGAEVELVPGGATGKVRGMQRFLREATSGGYSQCLALNIPDLGKSRPRRGQVLCIPGYLKPARTFHVRMTAVSGLDQPIRNAEAVKFHTGTSEEVGKIYLLEGEKLPGGRTGFATVTVDSPTPAAVHDRFILRRPSPAATVGGGEILSVSYSGARARKKEMADRLREYSTLFEGVDPASPQAIDTEIEYHLRTSCPAGASLAEIARHVLLPDDVVRESMSRDAKILELASDCFIHEDAYRARLEEVDARIQEAAAGQEALSLNLGDLRKGRESWPAPLWTCVQKDLERERRVAFRGSKLILHAAVDSLSEADRELMGLVLRAYEDAGFKSPRPDELPGLLDAPKARIDRLLDHLCNEGSLVRLAKNVVLSYSHLKQAQDIVVRSIREKGVLDSADFKYAIVSTRKYALAILDFLDARRVTVRNGNERRLAVGYEKNLIP